MKTTWHLYILWSVLSLSIVISSTAGIYESPSIPRPVRRKKLSHAGNRESSLRLTSYRTSPSPQLTPDLAPFSSTRHEKLRLVRREIPGLNIQSDFAYLADVSVTCSTSDLVVRVKTNFYDLGASAAELTLGSNCKSNGILRPYGDLLFTYPLTACDFQREIFRGHFVYNYVLHYVTSSKRNPTRRNRIDVDIQCWFQRHHHVYQLAVRPTWQTPVVHKRLKGRLNAFQIQLMDDLWAMPAKSRTYQIGQTVNFQVSTSNLPPGGKLYINSCYATPSNASKLSPTYTIIDNYGCLLESQRTPMASRFIYPRTDKTLRFSLSAFQFRTDPDVEVVIHCKLFVTSEYPSPACKSCTYRENRWRALTGNDSICDCCAAQCVTSKSRRDTVEGSASSGPLLVSDQPSKPEDNFLPVIPSLVGMIEEEEEEEEEEDEDVLRFETEMLQQISEFHSPETQLDNFDMAKYDGDADQQSPSNSMMEEEGDEEMEEDNGVTLEEKMDKINFSPGLIMEEKQQSSVRDSELFGKGGSGSVVTGQFLEREEGELRSESELERKRSELKEAEVKEDGVSNEMQGVHLQKEEETPLGTGVEEMLLSEKEGISKTIEKWGEDTEQPLETRRMEEEKGEKSTGRGEEVEEAIASEVEWQIDDGVPSDDLVETIMVDGREMTWLFKWR